MNTLSKDHYIGCLLGGAVGDALGAPTEFMELAEIIDDYGKEGVSEYVEYSDHKGRFTDDTQMTLFTAEGLLRAFNRKAKEGVWDGYLTIVYQSYLRWLHTQREQLGQWPDDKSIYNGWLIHQPLLYQSRAPGMTCMDSLRSGKMGSLDHPINYSKGCGGVMRAAPAGLLFSNPEEAFQTGAETAAITHNHPCGYLPAGALASILAFINQGVSLDNSISETLHILQRWDRHEKTTKAIRSAIDLFEKEQPTFKNVERLGGGWVGEEALAISIYCALNYPNDFEKAIILAINHSGDTDSTGSITGNMLGLLLGRDAIPSRWRNNLELSQVVIEVAEDLHARYKGNGSHNNAAWDSKYPAH